MDEFGWLAERSETHRTRLGRWWMLLPREPAQAPACGMFFVVPATLRREDPSEPWMERLEQRSLRCFGKNRHLAPLDEAVHAVSLEPSSRLLVTSVVCGGSLL
jgi:hypothetical protein